MRFPLAPVRLESAVRLCLLVVLLGAPLAIRAQEVPDTNPRLEALHWRSVGPYRGGRSTAVTGHPSHPATYFMGVTGGGLWRTDDNGITWEPISDAFFGGSIGAIDIADSDPNVIYVGTGSADIRGNTSTGHGVWKSTDGGDSWTFMGLGNAGQIGSIETHPHDADVVYAAALGRPFGANPERGVYRSRDGGTTWEAILQLSDRTGAMDIQFDMNNPRIMYASMWTAERKPWTLISGSDADGLWKTRDGGDTWVELTNPELDNGLPTGTIGKIGIAVSPADSQRVWALIQANEPHGGIYRSDDGGGSWQRVNRERKLRQRAWYFGHVIAHPTDPNTVFALNTRTWKSIDAGRTWEMIRVPHGDVHDLWINPDEPDRMVVGNDGGAQVTVNGGRTWSTYYNQPTAEFYDVFVDNGFPYYLYGGQQDNTTIGVPAWSDSNTLYPKMAWRNPGGCETGPVAMHPDDPSVTYGGCYGGALSRVDQTAGEYRDILSYPELQEGKAGRDLRYRYQWVSPILVSLHNPEVVYHASNYVHRTTDTGFNWEVISPDLTTNNPEHQDFAGGPLEHDITGVEIFGTIFALAESPRDAMELWTGSDDGLVHVTRDGGTTWTNVTPPQMPEVTTIDEIELSTHAAGRALVAAHRYRTDDFAPYVFRTDDFGATWQLLTDGTNGIPDDYPVRTVREDPDRRGLLYAGTEYGVFVSFDDGGRWEPLQNNLPVTPITGMRVHEKDLVVATQGRSFWILDDLTPLHQAAEAVTDDVRLYAPRRAWRANRAGATGELLPEAPPTGATIYYSLSDSGAEAAAETPLRLEILDGTGAVIRTFPPLRSSGAEEPKPLPAEAGLNRVTWDLQHEAPFAPEGSVVWGYSGGPKATPGTYTVRLTSGEMRQEQSFPVMLDPRLADVTQEQLDEQQVLSLQLRDRIQALWDAVVRIRSVREQVGTLRERATAAGIEEQVEATADALLEELEAIERLLIAKDAEQPLDLANFTPQLASEYAHIYQYVTGPDGYIAGGPDRQPTAGAYDRYADLEPRWSAARDRLAAALAGPVAELNAALEAAGVNAVQTDAER
jgi:photosystem II stability/assembly factor-like uncharacterized protein